MKKILVSTLAFSLLLNPAISWAVAQPGNATPSSHAFAKKGNPPATFNPQIQQSLDKCWYLQAMEQNWLSTADSIYFAAFKKTIDELVNSDGSIKTIEWEKSTAADFMLAKSVLNLYQVTGQRKYFKAAETFKKQLNNLKKDKDGSFIFPGGQAFSDKNLDQLAIAPFYLAFATTTANQADFENQLKKLSNLPVHNFVQFSKSKPLIVKNSGVAAHFLLNILDEIPKASAYRAELEEKLIQIHSVLTKHQQANSGTWSHVLVQRKVAKADFSTTMLIKQVLLSSVRKGYFPNTEIARLKLTSPFVSSLKLDAEAKSLELLWKNEKYLAELPKPGLNRKVMLDSYFNNEMRKDQSGNLVSWHYKWDERSNGGFSFWGGQFANAGYELSTLYAAPSSENLQGTDIYIIVDPDFEKENPRPNFILQKDIKAITAWVKAGGILVLMGNDAPNVELKHFNELANEFGVRFNGTTKGFVPKEPHYETAKIDVLPDNPIFAAKEIFVKEYSSLTLSAPAKSLLNDKEGEAVMSATQYGKGLVFVIGDPWLYNEYVDGRKLPKRYENFKAGEELIIWLSKHLANK